MTPPSWHPDRLSAGKTKAKDGDRILYASQSCALAESPDLRSDPEKWPSQVQHRQKGAKDGEDREGLGLTNLVAI